jgi:hypothetical protein
MRNAPARILLAYGTLTAGFLLLLACTSGLAAADDVSGTWTSNVAGEGYFDSTAPADFHYDVTLQLSSGGSGSLVTTCRKVDINMAGWEEARQGVGKSWTYQVSGTVSGNRYTMMVAGYSFPLTVSGGRMTGSGSYTDSAGTLNTWRYDLKGGGLSSLGDTAAASAAGAAIGGIGAAAGLAASLVPAPKPVPIRTHPTPHLPQPRHPHPPGPYEQWGRPPPQIYPNTPPQQPYTVAPGDARMYEPQTFAPIMPDPGQMQSLGGIGATQGPPDTPPPPNPPRGNETINDNNPHHLPAPPGCGAKCMPLPTPRGWRWRCTGCGQLPWG